MNLFELFNPMVPGLETDGGDNSRPKWGETRKTKLTLRQIRKLRKMMDIRGIESKENLKKIQMQYKPKTEDAGPGMM
jgi:hypothetical protein